jgi:hypothetical protein
MSEDGSKKASPDSPPTKTNTTSRDEVTPVKYAMSAPEANSAAKSRRIYKALVKNPTSSTGQKAANTASASMYSVSSALNNANDLFNHLYKDDAPSRNAIRNKLQLIKNKYQMENVWGEYIVKWAKCDNDRIKKIINCPCCYLCGKKINGKTHMEHKIPSVSAYLNVPNILRIDGTKFLKDWENYINGSNNFEQLTQLYNLINCDDNYDVIEVNNSFDTIFNDAKLPNKTQDDIYRRNLLKFWMMEFAYAHEKCNLFKSDVIMCSPRAAGARARDDDYDDKPIENAEICIDQDIISQKYDEFTKNITLDYPIKSKNRTIAMFGHLNDTLKALQESYFIRYNNNPLHDDTSAVANVIFTNPASADINRNTIIATNMRFAMNAPLIYEKLAEINKIQVEIESGNITHQYQLVGLMGELDSLWPGTSARFDLNKYLLEGDAAEFGMSTPPPPSNEKSAGEGEEKQTPFTAMPPSGPRPSVNLSSNQKRRRNYIPDDKSGKKGGTIKNKRRTKKRIASRRRKRNKRSSTRRKIYTRKQKK